MATQLPIVKIGKEYYFLDSRLNEIRNIKDPADREKLEGSPEFYLKTFGVKKSMTLKILKSKAKEMM